MLVLMGTWHCSDLMPFCLHKYSLFTLRECITDRGEGGVHNETASASAHSVISAINSQEIQTMIQEVEALDEETLKVKKNVVYHSSINSHHL